MTFHDRPTSLEDLAFPSTAKDVLAAIQTRGGTNDTVDIPAQGYDQKSAPLTGNLDTRSIQFFVPGAPRGKGRPRAARRGKFVTMYTDKKTVTYESTVALFASQAMAGRAPIDGPTFVVMTVAHEVPRSWSKKKRASALSGNAWPTVKPDADNVVKAVFDAINGVVWRDDTQVVALWLTKRYAEAPGVEVTITTMGGA